MIAKHLVMVLILAATGFPYDSTQVSELINYTDQRAGFTFNYPDYWVLVDDVESMIAIQDGTIDLIREEDLSESELAGFRVMVHIDGTHEYISNTAVLVYPHQSSERPVYENCESAVQAVKRDFEANRASGTYFLEETYIGESHAFVYRRDVRNSALRDEIRITYYVLASRSHAYMLVETVLMSDMTGVTSDYFNQIIQSFRIDVNESDAVDPSLDWGIFKPGEWTESEEDLADVGRVEIREDFQNSTRGWPVGEDSTISDGRYILDSSDGFPFTIRNFGLGQILFDFSFEGEVTFIDGEESAGYGLVFAYRDPDNYLAFLINRGGRFLVIEEKDGVVEEIVSWTASELLDGDTHRLMVQGDYQTITVPDLTHRYEIIFYIDDEPVSNIRMNRVLDISGWFGVFVSKDLNVAFEWLESRNYVLDAVFSLERFE